MRIGTLLVANRGEITRRIFRTAKLMGIRCIAVYTNSDRDEPFVLEADESIALSTNYLDIGAIIEAAKKTNSNAVHPGYGFLSENPDFAKAVIESGIEWVGPSPQIIEVMGDKIKAKELAQEANLPTLPSSNDLNKSKEVGFPLLVKAAAGGGGKGMRQVYSEKELPEAIASAQREAQNAFGDDRVFLEKYITKSRHIEIQILGDSHGNLLHLGERECSIQRRHQKIIEESPSPVVNEALREAMTQAALSLGNRINYQSAGTVEFLLDAETNNFFFLEVNTRLQVEHPVTEEVTGIDLVREQINIAAGEKISFKQSQLKINGHSIEARLYAENPAKEFLPATGKISVFNPSSTPSLRWDSGVETGSIIGVDFDPMLAKVISHAPTRAEATSLLALGLEKLHFGGVTTNREFLVSTLRHQEFFNARTTTDFIEKNSPLPQLDLNTEEIERAATAAALWLQAKNRREAVVFNSIRSGWSNGRLPDQEVLMSVLDQKISISYKSQHDGSFIVNGFKKAIIHACSIDEIDLEFENHRMKSLVTLDSENIYVQTLKGTASFHILPRFEPPKIQITEGSLVAPMPGLVLEIRVSVGDSVIAGETLLTLEAMKMEHHVKAPYDGTVIEILVSENQQLDNGVALLVVEPRNSVNEGEND